MKDWKFGASAKEFERLQEYANQFELLEIYLEQDVKTCHDPIENIAAQIIASGKNPYSVHLRYKPFLNAHKDGVDAAIYDLSLLCMSGLTADLGVELFVAHTSYPKNRYELYNQIIRLGEAAHKYEVVVAVENLCDRKNHTKGYMPSRNPRAIALVLEELGNPHLGLCIDTGHAISNSELTDSLEWDDDIVRKWIRHVHYNDNVPGKDLHLPISDTMSRNIIANFKYLTQNSKHEGVMIFEHSKLEEAVMSEDYVQTAEYRDIVPRK